MSVMKLTEIPLWFQVE